MQDAGAVTRPAHPGVGDADHVPDTFAEKLVRYREHAVLGHARAALGACVAEHENRVGADVEPGIVDATLHVPVVLEDDRGPRVAQEMRRCGEMLDHSPVRCQVSAQDGEATVFRQRVLAGPDDPLVVDGGLRDVLAEASVR